MSDELNAVITPVEPGAARPGPLAGKTLLVKDLIDTAGIRTTYGSRIYADHVPERTATSAQRLLDAGATLVGKANLPEFAWGVLGQSQWYGTVHNPLHPGKTTGGSSAGNAAAIAAGMCDLGLGTDTGCSIRLPAACCGIVGLKPSWGRVPIDGVYPLVPSLDTVGPMARTVEDVALMWSVLTGEPVPEPRLAGLTAGLLTKPPYYGGAPSEPVEAAEGFASDLEAAGARVVAAEIPDAPGDLWPLFFAEAAESHRATFPARAEEYSDNCRTKLEQAQHVDRAAVAHAYEALAEWRRYEPDVDLYVTPCLGMELPDEDADEIAVRGQLPAYLRPFNFLGWAGLAFRGSQLVAPRDEVVLAAGLALERA
jgi:Asp-tRNA(Asn)/Glu-tRNA(Gln) amidotransferase A subunit family amidase